MIAEGYYKQVALLLRILPELSRFEEIALHGGTAINLFVRDMPRLSVDIDLTYVPIESRENSLHHIKVLLTELKSRLHQVIPGIRIMGPNQAGAEYKLFCQHNGVVVKLEVNTIIRGVIEDPVMMSLSGKVQETFDAFAAMQVVPISQLMGGKIIAALDRQHPRDLFDVKLLLDHEGLSSDYVKGVLFGLLSSNRPIHELLAPTLQDQAHVLNNQFAGMTVLPFSYAQYEMTRQRLVQEVKSCFSKSEKAFLISFATGEPDWNEYDFSAFPSVRWKWQHLQRLKDTQPEKMEQQVEALQRLL